MTHEGVLDAEEQAKVHEGLSILQAAIGLWASSRGFKATDPHEVNHDQKLLLIVSEAVEAQEELRHGHGVYETYYEQHGDELLKKPCGYLSELADIAIRLFQLGDDAALCLPEMILEKHRYNGTRPFRHGKRF